MGAGAEWAGRAAAECAAGGPLARGGGAGGRLGGERCCRALIASRQCLCDGEFARALGQEPWDALVDFGDSVCRVWDAGGLGDASAQAVDACSDWYAVSSFPGGEPSSKIATLQADPPSSSAPASQSCEDLGWGVRVTPSTCAAPGGFYLGKCEPSATPESQSNFLQVSWRAAGEGAPCAASGARLCDVLELMTLRSLLQSSLDTEAPCGMDEVWTQTPCEDDPTGLQKFSFARAATLCVSSSDATQTASAVCCADYQGEGQAADPFPASGLPDGPAGEEVVVEAEAPAEASGEAAAPEEPFPASGLPDGPAGEEDVVEAEAPEGGVTEAEAPAEVSGEAAAPEEPFPASGLPDGPAGEEDVVEAEAPEGGVTEAEAPAEVSGEAEAPEEPFPASGLPDGPVDGEETEEGAQPPQGWDGLGSAGAEGAVEFRDLESLMALPALSLLSSAVSALGADGRLASAAAQGSTLFFPNDAAVQRFLAKFDPEFVTDLSDVPGIKLILDYHVGQGAFNLGDFGGADAIKSSDAAEILRTDYLRRESIVTSRGTPLSLGVGTVNGVPIVSPELTVGEGGSSTAYLIDEVLLPPGYHSSLME